MKTLHFQKALKTGTKTVRKRRPQMNRQPDRSQETCHFNAEIQHCMNWNRTLPRNRLPTYGNQQTSSGGMKMDFLFKAKEHPHFIGSHVLQIINIKKRPCRKWVYAVNPLPDVYLVSYPHCVILAHQWEYLGWQGVIQGTWKSPQELNLSIKYKLFACKVCIAWHFYQKVRVIDESPLCSTETTSSHSLAI